MGKVKQIKPRNGGFTQVRMTHKTFSKDTKLWIGKNVPGAASYKKIGKDYLIKDKNNKTIATWHHSTPKNGLVVIH